MFSRVRHSVRRACALVWPLWFAGACGGSGDVRPLRVGDAAPPYAARSLEGGAFELALLKGDAVLLNVWATWCVPCRTEMPALQAVHEKFHGKGLRVVGINIDAGNVDDDVRAFLDAYHITFPNVRDPEDRVTRVFRLIGVPETILIDADSRVAFRWIGQVARTDVERRVQELLKTAQ